MSWESFVSKFNDMLPEGTPRRKLVQILAIILVFEGVSVIILFSYTALAIGVFSLALGLFLLILLVPQKGAKQAVKEKPAVPEIEPPGIRLVDAVMAWIGNDLVVVAAGIAVISAVLIYNLLRVTSVSDLWDAIGDMDTLAIMFGAVLAAYPYLAKKFKTEAVFTLLFIGFVVLLLVVPQAIASLGTSAGTSVGNWYVEYMLAAPFAAILNAIGIPATHSGNMVVITFQDGLPNALTISSYCAGLYSFSIFVSAFFAFVLVFERIPWKPMLLILALGLFVAYIGNIFRMVIIGVVGYYYGIEALLWTHENIGWMIFLTWVSVFFYLLIRYSSRYSRGAASG